MDTHFPLNGLRMGVRNATSRYDRSVFLNCPFDDIYKPILDAIMFCIRDSGFVAEIALNDIGTGKTRLAKIVEMIGRCRYSIHDLCRVGEPRLNMAFECGICYGVLAFGGGRHKSKDLFVLDAENHRYKKTMSDIAGQDADVHHNDPLKAIDCVRSFLARKSGVKPFPGATYIAQRYRRFTEVLPGAASAAKVTIDELRTLKYLPDLVNLMVTFEPQGPAFVRFGRPNHEPPEIAFDLLFGALIEPVEQRFSSVAQRASPPLRTA